MQLCSRSHASGGFLTSQPWQLVVATPDLQATVLTFWRTRAVNFIILSPQGLARRRGLVSLQWVSDGHVCFRAWGGPFTRPSYAVTTPFQSVCRRELIDLPRIRSSCTRTTSSGKAATLSCSIHVSLLRNPRDLCWPHLSLPRGGTQREAPTPRKCGQAVAFDTGPRTGQGSEDPGLISPVTVNTSPDLLVASGPFPTIPPIQPSSRSPKLNPAVASSTSPPDPSLLPP